MLCQGDALVHLIVPGHSFIMWSLPRLFHARLLFGLAPQHKLRILRSFRCRDLSMELHDLQQFDRRSHAPLFHAFSSVAIAPATNTSVLSQGRPCYPSELLTEIIREIRLLLTRK
jgi:hypothetical protein